MLDSCRKEKRERRVQEGRLSLGKEGESGQEVWGICRKKEKSMQEEWMTLLKRGRSGQEIIDIGINLFLS